MADGYKLWKDCPIPYCIKGKVTKPGAAVGDPPVKVDCPICGGSGFVFFGWCSADVFTMPANLPEPE